MPQTRFAIASPASSAYLSDAFLHDTVPALRREAAKVLAERRIESEVIDQRLRTGLAAIAILEGRPADAERMLVEARARASKPQHSAIGFLANEAVAAGLQVEPQRQCSVTAERIAARLRGTDPQVVRDEVLLRLSQSETASEGYFAGTVVGILDESVRAQQSVGLMDGMLLALFRVGSVELPRCRAEASAAWRAWANDPANRPREIWTSREPASDTFAGTAPVTVAVWDTGIDYNLFAGQLAIDPSEPLDGRDNDGNGVVDDAHGPTFDYLARPTPFPIAPPSDFLAPRLALSMAFDKGQLDLNYGLDTAEARLFAQRAREASTADQGQDVDASAENAHRGHGTFVASQIADRAPYVRIYNLRLLPAGYDPKPVKTAEPEARRFADAMLPAVQRMRAAKVRVVNMSWGWTVDSAARHLLETGQETDPVKARERGRAMYDVEKAALAAAFAAAPEILFVAAAGNNNQSDETLSAIPQAARTPNLIVVGATGQTGQPTGFTTFGAGIDLYARGEGAFGRVPGGMSANWSGTSMAAPLVSRAAAQMLAVNPRLSPQQLIDGLRATATAGQDGMKLLHASAAVDWARTR